MITILSLDIPTFIFVIINLLVLYFILKRILFKRVTEHMEKRTKSISDAIENAKLSKAEAYELKQKYEDRIKKAGEDADRIIGEAHDRAAGEYDSMINSAKRDSEAILSKAGEDIERERLEMIKEVRNQVAGLALAAASKVLEANMNTESNRHLVDKFIDEAGAA